MIKYFMVFGIKINVFYKNLRDHGNAGLYYYGEKKIELDDKLSRSDENITAMHELFHATSDRLGLKNTGLKHEIEEIIVDNFAKVIDENFVITPKFKRKP